MGALGTAVGATEPSASPSSSTWIGVSADGLTHAGAAGTARLTLFLDGTEVASGQESFVDGRHPLALAVKGPFGAASPAALEIVLAWDGALAARLVGTLSDGADGLALAVSRAEFDSASPIVATGVDAFSVVKGWSDASVTIALAWADGADGPAMVRFESDVPGASALVAEARDAGDGAWTAAFVLERVPDATTWRATIERAGVVLGSSGASVEWSSQTVSDASFTSAPRSGLVAAGGFHELTTRSERLGVPASLFGASLEAAPECATGGVFGSMGGAAWRIAGLPGGAGGCGEESSSASVTATEASGDGFAVSAGLVAAVLVGAVAVAASAWGVWHLAHRRRSLIPRHH